MTLLLLGAAGYLTHAGALLLFFVNARLKGLIIFLDNLREMQDTEAQ